MAISAAGIGSNLDVNGLVSQLMAIERQPLTRLQSKVNAFNTDLSEYGRVQSEVAAIRSSAKALGSTAAVDLFKATLSDANAASVSVGSGASAGDYAVREAALARAQTLVSPNSNDGGATRITDAEAAIGAAGDLTLRRAGGAAFTVSLSGLGLNGIRDAINNAVDNFGVAASVINDGSGFRLVLRARDTGVANAVTAIEVANTLDAGFDFLAYATGTAYAANAGVTGESVTASDASVVVDGVAITSSSNVFATAIEGVTLVARAETASSFTLRVTRDDDALVARAQAFVDAYNTFFTNTGARYAKGGSLSAEGSLLTIMNGLSALVTQQGGPAGNAFAYLFEAGISIDKTGKLGLNAATLRAALADDPAAVGRMLGDSSSGLLARFEALAGAYLDSGGIIDARQGGIRAMSGQLAQRIDTLSARLTVIETRYRAQFATLDALLGRLNQTSVALTRALQ
ncbi:MAG: hypothetical protein FGM40_08880 [Rhodocyclaceae bacterium]|nr:hypothetical protein [Rhodocyclaceae bacterium]